MRCFGCQEFGHSRKFCKKSPKCWKCGQEGHDGSECSSDSICCVNCKGDHFSSSKNCPVWIHEKKIQRVKAEKNLPYGEARRLVNAKSPPPSATTTLYASVVRSTQKRSIECQTPDFWMQDRVTLKELSKKPSIETTSTGSGTERPISPANRTNVKTKQNASVKSPSYNEQKKSNVAKTGNKFLSLPMWTKTWKTLHHPLDRVGRRLVLVGRMRTFRLLNINHEYSPPMELSRINEQPCRIMSSISAIQPSCYVSSRDSHK